MIKTALRAPLFLCAGLAPSGCVQDKEAHFIAGAAVSRYVTDFSGSPAYGCLAALSIGVAKEAVDRSSGGAADGADFLPTTAGCSHTIRW
ncbi:MAG: hypothetical protein HKP40_08590 [Litoreibacter sp.]|nr:hypothetical protein [Litoreibacter sp.]